MKAKLVDINLTVRIVVEDDASEEVMIAMAKTKAQHLAKTDPTWLVEGMGEFLDDEEMPYEECTENS